MNKINAYNNINIKNKSINSDIDIASKKQNSKKTENHTKDTIEIEQKNQTVINTKKAYDALQETCKEFGTVECGGFVSGNMQFYVNNLMIFMEDEGISVPNFDLKGDNINNNGFLDFVDKLKSFAQKAMQDKNSVNIAPDNFFDFCDSYKEKLIRNGCS